MKKNIFRVTYSALLVTLIIFPIAVFAADYTLLQPLPGEGGGATITGGLSQYLGWLYKFALAAAAFLAVLMIVIGGIQMIVGGASETARSDGKKRIEQAIWGLLLAITAWLILYSINPDLVKTGLTIPPITIEAPVAPTERRACSGCAAITTDIPIKNTACKCEGGGTCNCYVEKTVLDKLKILDGKLGSMFGWQVTEAYPPTVPHLDSCHNNSTCVDIALTKTIDIKSVNALIKAAKDAGFKVTNEYPIGEDPKKFETTTAPHLHIEI